MGTRKLEDSAGLLCEPALLRRAAAAVGRQILADEAQRGSAEPPDETAARRAAIDVYAGPPGLALFWAALARAFPEEREEHSGRSLSALAATRWSISRWLDDPACFDAERVPLGGLHGLGGAIYALTCAGVLLGEPDLLSEASAAVALITPERIARARRFDLVDGVAGTVLALLALERVRGGEPRAAALLCADHLLAHRQPISGFRVWVTEGKPPYCGFAHGMSGIVWALLRTLDCGGPASLGEAAREGMAFERLLYRSEVRNWPPFADFPESSRPLASWCWGAPGIALGRIAALEILDEPEIRDDIRKSLETTVGQKQALEDHVCCGNLGRAQILSFAARHWAGDRALPPEELLAAADRLVYGVLRRARGRGGFGWSARPEEEAFVPSFFKGAAGVGYALLDLAEPGALPLPLLLEPPLPGEGARSWMT